MCPHSNSAAQRETFPCCVSILTATPLYVTGQYRHVFDLEVLETTDVATIYELPRSYDLLDNVTGILIYSDYAYAAVREDSNLRLHPLSPGAPEKTWEDFYTAAQSYAKTHSELSGVENYGFD